MKLISRLFIGALIALTPLLTACNNEDNANTESISFFTIATLKANNDAGCTFTVQEKDDSEIVTYTYNKKLSGVTVGKRYRIIYMTASGKQYESGALNYLGIGDVCNGKVENRPLSVINTTPNSLLRTSWIARTGSYINFFSTAPYQSYIKVINIYVNDETTNNSIPDAYLVYSPDDTNSGDKQFYSSIDISEVWKLNTCKGIRLHYYDGNGVEATTTFKKGEDFTPVQ